jgi:hypothetical protein
MAALKPFGGSSHIGFKLSQEPLPARNPTTMMVAMARTFEPVKILSVHAPSLTPRMFRTAINRQSPAATAGRYASSIGTSRARYAVNTTETAAIEAG